MRDLPIPEHFPD